MNHSKGLDVYLAVMLTIGVLLLALIAGLLIYGGVKISQESKTISTKVNDFNNQVKNINTNLQNIDNQLKLTKVGL